MDRLSVSSIGVERIVVVVVRARFRETQFDGDVRIAEAVETARLYEALRRIEDPRGGAGVAGSGCRALLIGEFLHRR